MRITRFTKADALRLTHASDALPRAKKALADASLTPGARQVLIDFVNAQQQSSTGTKALDVLLTRKHVDTARVLTWLDDAARDIAAADARTSLAASSAASALPAVLQGLKAASFEEINEWLDG